jgi:hypothetical protein
VIGVSGSARIAAIALPRMRLEPEPGLEEDLGMAGDRRRITGPSLSHIQMAQGGGRAGGRGPTELVAATARVRVVVCGCFMVVVGLGVQRHGTARLLCSRCPAAGWMDRAVRTEKLSSRQSNRGVQPFR